MKDQWEPISGPDTVSSILKCYITGTDRSSCSGSQYDSLSEMLLGLEPFLFILLVNSINTTCGDTALRPCKGVAVRR